MLPGKILKIESDFLFSKDKFSQNKNSEVFEGRHMPAKET